MKIQRSRNGLLSIEISAYLLRLIFPNYPELKPCHALSEEIQREINRTA